MTQLTFAVHLRKLPVERRCPFQVGLCGIRPEPSDSSTSEVPVVPVSSKPRLIIVLVLLALLLQQSDILLPALFVQCAKLLLVAFG